MHNDRRCTSCDAPLPPQHGRGRKRKYCARCNPAYSVTTLPHPRPCWCDECRLTYLRTYAASRYWQGKDAASCIKCRKILPHGEHCTRCARLRNCSYCQAEFDGKRPTAKYCCPGCKHRAAYERKYKRETRTCGWCYTPFDVVAVSATRCCGGVCSKALQQHTELWHTPDRCILPICMDCRAPTGLPPTYLRCAPCMVTLRGRRAVAKSLGDDVHWTDIYDRDKGMCHICGGRVKRYNTWSTSPDAPTVDHLVPIDHGGEDTLENTALAHRGCNSSKGTKAIGEQLRLVG